MTVLCHLTPAHRCHTEQAAPLRHARVLVAGVVRTQGGDRSLLCRFELICESGASRSRRADVKASTQCCIGVLALTFCCLISN